MPSRKIVLDTNCLISSLSKRGQYYPVWKGLQTGKYVSDDKHYNVLKTISFPKILVLRLKEFLGILQTEDNK